MTMPDLDRSTATTRRHRRAWATALVLLLAAAAGPTAGAQPAGVNYDESKVGEYTPLDPLTASEGRKVTTPDLWTGLRRPELLRHFETEMYGRVPQPPEPIRPSYRLRSEDKAALDGKAVRREVT